MCKKDGLIYYSVEDTVSGERLDRVLSKKFDISFSKLQKLIRVGFFKVNKKRTKASHKVKTNDIIQYSNLDDIKKSTDKKTFKNIAFIKDKYKKKIIDIKKHIIFEDEYIAIINKPQGIPVQGGSNVSFNIDMTLPFLIENENNLRLVHRIDKSTSGILILAKTKDVAREITYQFKSNIIMKKYWAVVVGKPKNNKGKVIISLAKKKSAGLEKIVVDPEGGDYAETYYKVLESKKNLSLIEILPKTGRKHQIRVHLQSIGIPILGDNKYYIKDKKLYNIKSSNLHLHAKEIKFILNKKKYFFDAKLPQHFINTMQLQAFNEKYYE